MANNAIKTSPPPASSTATTTAELTEATQLGNRLVRCSACQRHFNERTTFPSTISTSPPISCAGHPVMSARDSLSEAEPAQVTYLGGLSIRTA